MRYAAKWPEYAKQWDRMRVKASRRPELTEYAQYAIQHKEAYREIQQRTGVDWCHVAVIHRRESNGRFDRYLGNGESLKRKTLLVPKGRGPFSSFLDGAIDALHIDGLDDIKDWRLEKILYYCELFNGPGYANRGIPSPYLWGGTNIQSKGKYVADGKWNPNAMDSQPGCAPILQLIAGIDTSVTFVRES